MTLPVRSREERHHSLTFLVSFVVPYYAIHSERHVLRSELRGIVDVDLYHCFELTPDEVPYANVVAEEIGFTFLGYEPMPPEVGVMVIPDAAPLGRFLGEATIFTCLFSDDSWTIAGASHDLPAHLRGGSM